MPGLEFLNIPADAKIGDIIAALYVYGVGFVALAAFIVFTAGGVQYIFAGDKDPSKAKEWMWNAFWGLVLALTSWLILYTINPALVKNVGDLGLQEIQTNTSGGNPDSSIQCSCSGGINCFSGTTCPQGCTPTGAAGCPNPSTQSGTVTQGNNCVRNLNSSPSSLCVAGLQCKSGNDPNFQATGKCCAPNQTNQNGRCVP